MNRKIIIAALGLAALVAFAPAASAQTVNLESTLQNIDATPGIPYLRYYTPDPVSRRVTPGGRSVCTPANGLDWLGPATPDLESTQNACGAAYKSAKRAYRAYSDALSNFPPAGVGTIFYVVWDMQSGTGADRTGYYAWAGNVAQTGRTYDAFNEQCTGVVSGVCLGPVNPASAAGTENPFVPGTAGTLDATLNPFGGLRPIPVPRIGNDGATPVDPILLNWVAASGTGTLGGGVAQYDLYFAKDSTTDGACTARAGQFNFLKTVAETQTSVALSEIGEAVGNPSCVAFAIRLRFPSAGGVNPIISLNLSRAGQAIVLDGGVTAAEVYDLAARRVGAAQLEVSWKTSLEDGVRGFYVTRSFTENGAFQRVSGLIAAKGEPSAYSFIDTAIAGNARIPAGVTGVYYKIEAIDIDDNVTPFGPVRADLGVQNRPGRQQAAPNRR
ncbi:MAG: hypothetical protein HC882_05525 [Acidobacteria bacterium]|nr:hypothetical protein [Acidobacteriota bacterium]